MTDEKNEWLSNPLRKIQEPHEPVPTESMALSGEINFLLDTGLAINNQRNRDVVVQDDFEDTATYKGKSSAVIIDNISKTGINALPAVAEPLLWFINVKFNELYPNENKTMTLEQFRNKYSETGYMVDFSINDFLAATGKYPTQQELLERGKGLLKERRKTERKRIKPALDALYETSKIINSKNGGIGKTRLIQDYFIENSRLYIQLTEPLAYHLATSSITITPNKLLALQSLASQTELKLYNHYGQNRNRTNAKIISLKKLHESLTSLPTLASVKKSNRAISSRIKDPIFDALATLVEQGQLKSYTLTRAKSKPLEINPYDEITENDYNEIYIHFEPIEAVAAKVAHKKRQRKNRSKH